MVDTGGSSLVNVDNSLAATGPLPLTRESVQLAHNVIRPLVHRTPLLHSTTISDAEVTSSDLTRKSPPILFKAENLQRGGAFKIRGASYSLSALTPSELKHGVCTHSSGNHAGALALAARSLNVPCHLVMPHDSARPKLAAARAAGAHITLCEPTAPARSATLAQVQAATGATFVPPYDAVNTILGQGTVFLEMEEQALEDGWGELACVVVPVGGGGLLAGVGVAAHGTGVRVFGAEPKGADDCYRGIAAGVRVDKVSPVTIADGLRTPVGVINFPLIQSHVESILLVSEEEIVDAMRIIFERFKVVVEPSGAVAFAAVRSEAFKALKIQGPIGVVISGGNVDLDLPLPWLRAQPK